ncbi:DUF5947 family protein [Saccharopolyspora taberi]|uniref:DUF5947 family protein n=1 Tax=Saccharopolyspora taberi TaxID=60895 RepID=A0ABN3VH15_9PSEU
MATTLWQLAHRRPLSPPAPGNRCELCADALGERHHHILNTADGRLLCACPACGVLFDHQAAGGGHYRLIRSRPHRLGEFRLDDALWAEFGIPVGLAFFVRSGESDRVTAFYPNPVGTMRAAVDPAGWESLVGANPDLSAMDTDIESLLVERLRGGTNAWLLPVDECYRLVALLRTHWRGFTGGDQVWRQLDRFLADLGRRRS